MGSEISTIVVSNGWQAALARSVLERRKALKLTQADVAAFAECSKPFVVKLESGEGGLRLDKVVDVLIALGLELQIAAGKRGVVARELK